MEKLNLIKKLILETGLTQKEFAIVVNEKQSNVSAYATGKVNITIDKFQSWLDVFGFTLEIKTK